MDLYRLIRDIPDFPQKGVIFKDITPLLKDAEAFRETIDRLIERLQAVDFDYIVVPEARGFIFGSAIAYEMEKGSYRSENPGNFPIRHVKSNSRWNMAKPVSKSMKTPFFPARRSFYWMMFWPLAGRSKRSPV